MMQEKIREIQKLHFALVVRRCCGVFLGNESLEGPFSFYVKKRNLVEL